MSSIFLSYARGDDGDPFDPAASFVARLHRDLTAAGFDVWFDRVSMPSRALTFHQEIRDAVTACDRLVLVVGPKAAESLYVQGEWQFAYFTAEKIVTPILRRGEHKTHVPSELQLLHCEDFRDDSLYETHLNELIRQLSEPAPPLGKLVAVPTLPEHFLARTELLMKVREALRHDLTRTVGIGGATERVGMHGMGGIGKSLLAAAVARDRQTRLMFPDGIVWVGLGPLPTVAELQRRVHKVLCGDGAFQTEHEGRVKLRDILKDKGVLLILDDVWRREDVDWFDVLGPRCRAMITTRDAGLLTSLGGVHHQVELLTEAEALNLLAQAAAVERDKLPNEAADLIAECGRLPLAVALCGGLIRHGFAWAKVLEQLRASRIDRIKDPHAAKVEHENIWNAIDVSVKFLSADEQARFLELAVFPPDEATPIAALHTLWSHTAGFDDWDTDALVIKLSQRSLLELTPSAAGKAFSLHALVYDYVHRAAGDETALHQRLLEAYRKKCPDGWHVDPPNDGYFFTHLRDHLIEAGRAGELADLLQDLRWLEAKNEAGLTFDLIEDYNRVFQVSPDRSTFLPWYHFVRGQASVLAVHPELFFQQAFNEPMDSPVSRTAQQWVGTPAEPRHWLEWLNRSREFAPPTCLFLTGHTSGVCSVAVSADGQTAISAGGDETVLLWNCATGECLASIPCDQYSVRGVGMSEDGRTAVLAGDNTVLVWDCATGECRTFSGHGRSYSSSVAVSADGRTAILRSGDNTIWVWDLANGQCRKIFTGTDTGTNWSVAVTPDGLTALSGDGCKVRVWDVTTGECRAILSGHKDEVWSVAVAGNGRIAVSGSADQMVLVWDLSTGQCRALAGHVDGICSVAVSADGRTAVSVEANRGIMRVWDVTTGECRAIFGKSGLLVIRCVTLSADGRIAVSGGYDGGVRVWDLVCKHVGTTGSAFASALTSIAVSANGRIAVTVAEDSTMRVWDLATGLRPYPLEGSITPEEMFRTPTQRASSLVGASGWHVVEWVSEDGRTAVSRTDEFDLWVWDLSTGECRMGDVMYWWDKVTAGSQLRMGAQSSCSLSCGGFSLVVRATQEILVSFPGDFPIAAQSPDGRYIVAGDEFGHVYFLRLRSRDD